MIAGGSAITVALQVCEAVLRRHPKRGQVRLVLCNRTVEDIWFPDRLEELERRHGGFKVAHCISHGPLPKPRGKQLWFTGRIRSEVLAAMDPHLRAIISGPPGLCAEAAALLGKLGQRSEDIVVLDEQDKLDEEDKHVAAPCLPKVDEDCEDR